MKVMNVAKASAGSFSSMNAVSGQPLVDSELLGFGCPGITDAGAHDGHVRHVVRP